MVEVYILIYIPLNGLYLKALEEHWNGNPASLCRRDAISLMDLSYIYCQCQLGPVPMSATFDLVSYIDKTWICKFGSSLEQPLENTVDQQMFARD